METTSSLEPSGHAYWASLNKPIPLLPKVEKRTRSVKKLGDHPLDTVSEASAEDTKEFNFEDYPMTAE